MQIYGIPCWAVCGGSNLVSVILPPEVRLVTIFADGDDAGRRYAEQAAESHLAHARKVRIARPKNGHKDFNAMLMASAGRAAA